MSHSVDDYYDIYKREILRARKEHPCCACELTIKPGDLYCRVFVLFRGSKKTYKRCGRCETLHSHLCSKMDGVTWPDEDLGCGHDYVDEWGDLPENIARLAFVTPEETGKLLENDQ